MMKSPGSGPISMTSTSSTPGSTPSGMSSSCGAARKSETSWRSIERTGGYWRPWRPTGEGICAARRDQASRPRRRSAHARGRGGHAILPSWRLRMIMTEQAKITALDNKAYFLVTDEVFVTDAEGNGFPFEQDISSAVPLRRLDQQAVLRRHPLEGRFQGGREGRSGAGRAGLRTE